MKNLILSLSLCVVSSVAAAKEAYFDPQLAASASAGFLNHFKSFNAMVDSLKASFSKEEVEGIQKLLSENNWDGNTSIGKAKAFGSELVIENHKFIFNKDRTVSYKGRIYRAPSAGTWDKYLRDFVKENKPSSTGWNLQLIPSAYAFNPGVGLVQGLPALGGMVAGALAIGGTGLLYLGAEAWQSYNNWTVTCDKGVFLLRNKDRNSIKLAKSKTSVVKAPVVSQILGREVSECDEPSRKELEEKFASSDDARKLVNEPTSKQ